MENEIKIALMYDFDGTLVAGNMQEYSFIEQVGSQVINFWKECDELAVKNNADKILSCMFKMVDKARKTPNFSVTREGFKKHGENIVLFNGVQEWFKRINEFGKKLGVTIEHYIISSGLKEIIEGTNIANEFKQIFACEFIYDENGEAVWPSHSVNYTNKTQYLFRIRNADFNLYDSVTINKHKVGQKYAVPFKRMIYIGDGETDVPCMKLVRTYGGYSIAVYDPNSEFKKQQADDLMRYARADFSCPANYAENSLIDKVIKNIIEKMATEAKLTSISEKIKLNDIKE